MLLVIGGEASGKENFVRSLGYTDEDISENIMAECPVAIHVDKAMEGHEDYVDFFYSVLSDKDVVICNEVGSGVIPGETGPRVLREAIGRLTCKLADDADTVVRMTAGIPMCIKGEMPTGRI
ncbi:MAG: bifunctional adenosylcobinamide kinase/adenosylcobinamide-phosphate guanylyltransferase [Parasporobacterium sp.]|nr:bifunctional adenosylcobinamide kinase/adenosylcobinamide-phosphate guanylyltransferase [Parasporobacterium sp.]